MKRRQRKNQQATSPRRQRPSPLLARSRRVVRARYDVAQTTSENSRHWRMVDALSADRANSKEVRTTIRNRARHEVANNSYATGIVSTLAHNTIGTGPRLQMQTANASLNKRVEEEFARWAHARRLAQKLWTMRVARIVDGEAFGVLSSSDQGDTIVSLDLQLVECDRVTNPTLRPVLDPNNVDGILLNSRGEPISYTILPYHPGDPRVYPDRIDPIPAESVVHWFRALRPGQHRGVSELVACLELFALLRRYTLAVVGAAETAADFAAILFTDAPASGEAAPLDPMDVVELERRMLTVMPEGWKLGQVNAVQPTTTYAEFKRELLSEIVRCVCMPFNIAAGDSSGYNYASGRLDHQTYFKAIQIEQADCGLVVLDAILKAWLEELLRVPQYRNRKLEGLPPHQWFFDGLEHVDPWKEASAQSLRLANHATTYAAEYAKMGQDWEEQLKQRARELAVMRELGLDVASEATRSAPDETDQRDE